MWKSFKIGMQASSGAETSALRKYNLVPAQDNPPTPGEGTSSQFRASRTSGHKNSKLRVENVCTGDFNSA